MMKSRLFLVIASFYLTACGNNAYIADKIKFKVVFSKKLVQVSFQMNQDHKIEQSSVVRFEELGATFLKWNEKDQYNELGSVLSADPEILEDDWPAVPFKHFPNGRHLPRSVPRGHFVHEWDEPPLDPNGIEVALFYLGDPALIAGGKILSNQFDLLKNKFLATQKFFAPNGSIVGSISVAGPTRGKLGGLYFFGNFGENPFKTAIKRYRSEHEDEPISLLSHPDIVEWEYDASEPATIVQGGYSLRYMNLKNRLLNLKDQLSDFAVDTR